MTIRRSYPKKKKKRVIRRKKIIMYKSPIGSRQKTDGRTTCKCMNIMQLVQY